MENRLCLTMYNHALTSKLDFGFRKQILNQSIERTDHSSHIFKKNLKFFGGKAWEIPSSPSGGGVGKEGLRYQFKQSEENVE